MKAKKSTQLPLVHALLAGTILLAVGFTIGQSYKNTGKKDDRTIILDAIDALSDNTYGLPKSNLEWMTTIIGLTPQSLLKSSLMTTTLTGQVIDKARKDGSIPIAARRYYVGNPGTYAYSGVITLSSPDIPSQPIFFSAKRMEAMRVMVSRNGKLTPSSFEALAKGDTVEIEETVNLTRSNINDENLVAITVRIR